jgi:hypothetical protein
LEVCGEKTRTATTSAEASSGLAVRAVIFMNFPMGAHKKSGIAVIGR